MTAWDTAGIGSNLCTAKCIGLKCPSAVVMQYSGPGQLIWRLWDLILSGEGLFKIAQARREANRGSFNYFISKAAS